MFYRRQIHIFYKNIFIKTKLRIPANYYRPPKTTAASIICGNAKIHHTLSAWETTSSLGDHRLSNLLKSLILTLLVTISVSYFEHNSLSII